MAHPPPLYVLVCCDGRAVPVGPFSSRLSASDWRSDAEAQGVITAGRYLLRELTPPSPLIEPGL
jgi:hypothetical protein